MQGLNPGLPHCRWILYHLLFSHSVVPNSLWPHGLQHARLPCPSPSPGACANSCPSSQWCHPTILSFVIPFSSCHQSFPASGSFLMSQLFTSGSQNIGASASASVLPMTIQDFLLDGLVGSPCSPRDAQESSPTPWFKSINSSTRSLLYCPILTSIHDYWKTIAWTMWTFIGKVMSLLFNTLSRFVIAFLPRSKCLLISWLQSPSAVIFTVWATRKSEAELKDLWTDNVTAVDWAKPLLETGVSCPFLSPSLFYRCQTPLWSEGYGCLLGLPALYPPWAHSPDISCMFYCVLASSLRTWTNTSHELKDQCVCVCVWERERETERQRDRGDNIHKGHLINNLFWNE